MFWKFYNSRRPFSSAYNNYRYGAVFYEAKILIVIYNDRQFLTFMKFGESFWRLTLQNEIVLPFLLGIHQPLPLLKKIKTTP